MQVVGDPKEDGGYEVPDLKYPSEPLKMAPSLATSAFSGSCNHSLHAEDSEGQSLLSGQC